MTFNLSLIEINGKINSSRNAVVSVLTEKWPLSAKEIHNEIGKKFSLMISYQATHKTIKALEDDKILEQVDGKYQLNKEWITKTKQFAERLSQDYEVLEKSDSKIILPTLYDTDKFLFSQILNNLPKEGEKPFLGLHWSHFWIPLLFSIKEYGQIKEYAPYFDLYLLSRGNDPIDRTCAEIWKKRKAKIKTGVDCAAIADIVIYKDLVIEVFYSTEIKNELNKFFSETEKMEDLDIENIFENLFQKKTAINVLIHKNQQLAEQLKEQTHSYFREDTK